MVDESRFHGRVRAEGAPLSWAALEVSGDVAARWLVRRGFTLELDDGSRVEVEVSRSLELSPVDEHKDRWEVLEKRLEAAPFRGTGPAPHTKVTLRTATVVEGDEVTVVGTVLEERFEESGASHREAPATRPARVQASRVLRGPEPPKATTTGKAAARDEKPQRDQPPLGFAPFVLGALACAAFGFARFAFTRPGSLSPAVSSGTVFGLTLIAAAVAWAFYNRRPPVFLHRGARVDWSPRLGLAGGFVVGTAVVFLLTFTGWDLNGIDPDNGHVINNQDAALVVSSALAIACFAVVSITGRRTLRLAKVILSAPARAKPEAGAWSRLVGEVHDPTPVLGGEAALAATTELEWNEGSGLHSLREKTLENATFVVRGNGFEIELDPSDASWATDVRRFPAWWGYAGFRVPRGGKLLIGTELIPQKAALVVAGRPQGDGGSFSLRSTGPESLVLFATRPGGDPVRAVRRLRRTRILALAIIAACWAAAVGVSFAARPHLPPSYLYMPETDD